MQITKPTLLLDESIARANIERIAQKAEKSNTILRPHFKTHFSAEIGGWYRDAGVNACTASSIEMAEYFSENGWENITIAFPLNRLEIETIKKIQRKSTVNVLVEDIDTLNFLEGNLEKPIKYWIKIDIGTGRTGLSPTFDFNQLIRQEGNVYFEGFLAHAGHTYSARNHEEIMAIFHKSEEILLNLKSKYRQYNPKLSYGDTPSCSAAEDFSSFDEIRPGNLVFYDVMQTVITSCGIENIAVCMACPVVAKHPKRSEIVIHGGAVHFSKDNMVIDGDKSFGLLVEFHDSGWGSMVSSHHLVRLSQEHGILKVEDQSLYDSIDIGTVVGILPIHSCLTANLMGSYLTLDGKRILQMPKNTY